MNKIFNITFLLILFTASFSCGQNYELAEVIDLDELSNNHGTAFELSPDGNTIVFLDYMNHELCFYNINNKTINRYSFPDKACNRIHYFTWSPNGKYIAFTDDYFQYMHEPDIWIFNVKKNKFINCTDDNTRDSLMLGKGALIDILPVWDKNSKNLFFFRIIKKDKEYSTAIFRLTPGNSPKKIKDFDKFSSNSPVYYTRPAISNNGKTISICSYSPNPNDKLCYGVRLFNLESGEIKKIASFTQLTDTIPDWLKKNSHLITIYTKWVDNDKGLIIVLYNDNNYGSINIDLFYLYLNTHTNKITLLRNLDNISDMISFFKNQENNNRWIKMGIISQNSKEFLYLYPDYQNDSKPNLKIGYLPLPPDNSNPIILGELKYKPVSSLYPYNIITEIKNKRVVIPIYNYLLKFK